VSVNNPDVVAVDNQWNMIESVCRTLVYWHMQ